MSEHAVVPIVVLNGSMSQRGEGNWHVSYYWQDEEGKRHREWRTIHGKSKSAARRNQEYLRIEIQDTLNKRLIPTNPTSAEDKTFGQYSEEYINYRRESKSVEGATLRRNATDAKRCKWLLDIPVKAIKAEDVERLIVDLVKDGYSNTSIRGTITYVSQVLEHLVRRDILPKNPCRGVRKPKADKQKVQYLSKEERSRLLDLLEQGEQTAFTIAVYLAFYTGMRRGEICALKWGDIDFEQHIIHVVRAIGGGGAEYLKAPKSDEARDVPMCEKLEAKLAIWKVNYADNPINDYILGSFKHPNTFKSPTNITKEWRSFCRCHNFGHYTFHSLRHTFAQCLLVEQRLDPVTVAALLGHKDVSVTLNIYSAGDTQQKFLALPYINDMGAK